MHIFAALFSAPGSLPLNKSLTLERWHSCPTYSHLSNPNISLVHRSSSQFISPHHWYWIVLSVLPSTASFFPSLNNFHVRNRIPNHSCFPHCCFLIRQEFLSVFCFIIHGALQAFGALKAHLLVVISLFKDGGLPEVRCSFCPWCQSTFQLLILLDWQSFAISGGNTIWTCAGCSF